MQPYTKGFFSSLKKDIEVRFSNQKKLSLSSYIKDFILIASIVTISFALIGLVMDVLFSFIYIFIYFTVLLFTSYILLRLKYEQNFKITHRLSYNPNNIVLFNALQLSVIWFTSQSVFFLLFFKEIVGVLFIILLLMIAVSSMIFIIFCDHKTNIYISTYATTLYLIIFLISLNASLLFILPIPNIIENYSISTLVICLVCFTKHFLTEQLSVLFRQPFSLYLILLFLGLTMFMNTYSNPSNLYSETKQEVIIKESRVDLKHLYTLGFDPIFSITIEDGNSYYANSNSDLYDQNRHFIGNYSNYTYKNIENELYVLSKPIQSSKGYLSNLFKVEKDGSLSFVISFTSADQYSNAEINFFIFDNIWYQFSHELDSISIYEISSDFTNRSSVTFDDDTKKIITRNSEYVVFSNGHQTFYLDNVPAHLHDVESIYYVYNNGYVGIINASQNNPSLKIITADNFIADQSKIIYKIENLDIDIESFKDFKVTNEIFTITAQDKLSYDIFGKPVEISYSYFLNNSYLKFHESVLLIISILLFFIPIKIRYFYGEVLS